jgi:ribokinase
LTRDNQERMAPTLFVFGDLCVDIIAVPRSMPRIGDDATLDSLDVTCGGAAYNCAIAAAEAGAIVRVIGLVGDDEFGAKLIKSLNEHEVDTSLIQVRHDARTGTVLSIASPDGERTLYSYRGVNAEAHGPVPGGLLRPTDYVYLSGYSLQAPASAETAHMLRHSGAQCLLDPSFQSAASLVEADFLKGLDWITPNAREAELLTGSADPVRAAAVLRDKGIANVAITRGAEGCLLATANSRVRVPAEQLSVANNTTGAGDAFCGGLLAALLTGCDPLEAARRANHAAASTIASHNRKS